MTRQTFSRSVDIHAPIEAVFAWHERPDALRLLTPPGQRLIVLKPLASLHVGQRALLFALAGLIPTLWYVEHVVYDPPHEFVDRQILGPFWFWEHHHRFVALDAQTTRLTDAIEYALPGGKLGAWLGGRLVTAQLARMFEHRHQVTRQAIESAAGSNPEQKRID
ncbi:MAG: SRPBCC family protein [Candidatus Sericytochromatia bacterium]|nr:SRPBCC family protein [Candidatus Sericytochromatia bacterium]